METVGYILLAGACMGLFIGLMWLVTILIVRMQEITLIWEARTRVPAELYRLGISLATIFLIVLIVARLS